MYSKERIAEITEKYNKNVLQRFVLPITLMETIESLDSLFDNLRLPVLRKYVLESSRYRELVDMFAECFITRPHFEELCDSNLRSMLPNESEEVYQHISMLMKIVF